MDIKEIANIFALVARADGIIKPIEDVNAEAFLECLAADDRNEAISKYHQTKLLEDIPLPSAKLTKGNDSKKFILEQKLDIIRSLWAIAICDGELHPGEECVIYNFIDAINVSRRDSVRAQISARLSA